MVPIGLHFGLRVSCRRQRNRGSSHPGITAINVCTAKVGIGYPHRTDIQGHWCTGCSGNTLCLVTTPSRVTPACLQHRTCRAATGSTPGIGPWATATPSPTQPSGTLRLSGTARRRTTAPGLVHHIARTPARSAPAITPPTAGTRGRWITGCIVETAASWPTTCRCSGLLPLGWQTPTPSAASADPSTRITRRTTRSPTRCTTPDAATI